MSDQCKALIKQYWNNMHVVIDTGTPETKADEKPGTLQVILVNGMSKGQSEISSDGQVIYVHSDAGSNQEQLQPLIFTALERRIATGSGASCHGIEAFLKER